MTRLPPPPPLFPYTTLFRSDPLVRRPLRQLLEHLTLTRGEPAQGSLVRGGLGQRHPVTGGQPPGPPLQPARAHVVRRRPAVHQQLATLVPSPVLQQLPGEVDARLEGEER